MKFIIMQKAAELTYSEGKLTGFYAQWDTKELYISQVEADIHD